MRTTIRIDDGLLRQAREVAARTGRTLTAVIEDALRMALAPRSDASSRPHVRLTTVGGKGVRAGIQLDDSAGLLELMEAHDPS